MEPLVIFVRCDQTGDLAEALTERAAFVAARELCEEAHRYSGTGYTYKPTATFTANNEILLARVPEPAIWHALRLEGGTNS